MPDHKSRKDSRWISTNEEALVAFMRIWNHTKSCVHMKSFTSFFVTLISQSIRNLPMSSFPMICLYSICILTGNLFISRQSRLKIIMKASFKQFEFIWKFILYVWWELDSNLRSLSLKASVLPLSYLFIGENVHRK